MKYIGIYDDPEYGQLELFELDTVSPEEWNGILDDGKSNEPSVKIYRGRKIVVVDDFIALTGIDIRKHKKVFREEYFIPGVDWDGLGQGPLREEFEQLNNCHYDQETIIYMYESGFKKLIRILLENGTLVKNMRLKQRRRK